MVTEVAIHTRYAVARIVRDAFERATHRRNKVTLVAKSNVLVHSGGLWQATFDSVAADYPQVATDSCHEDAAAMFMLTSPERFDVVVTDNLFGDMLTEIGAAISGGIGLAASGNVDPSRRNPSMFESVHGSAPDIAGQGKAAPTAAVLSLARGRRRAGLRPRWRWISCPGNVGPGARSRSATPLPNWPQTPQSGEVSHFEDSGCGADGEWRGRALLDEPSARGGRTRASGSWPG